MGLGWGLGPLGFCRTLPNRSRVQWVQPFGSVPLPSPPQGAPLEIAAFVAPAINAQIRVAHPGSYDCWDDHIGSLTGFSLSELGVINASYVNPGITTDPDTAHYFHALEGWPTELRARAMFICTLALLSEMCEQQPGSTLTTIRNTFEAIMHGIDQPGQGLQLEQVGTWGDGLDGHLVVW